MIVDPHKIRCTWCDFKRIWRNLRHLKVARWTLVVHIIYYFHAAIDAHGGHFITAALCGVALVFELVSHDE